jgi:hypothetical protein
MNTRKFNGITSLILIAIATLIALVVMSLNSWVWGALYLAIMIIAPQAILRTYCAKCPCKTHCAHVFPGKAAMAFKKDAGPYTPTELIIMIGSLGVLIGLPQFWLWQYPVLFVSYWILSGIAFIQIRLTVCPGCNNIYCPVRIRARHP